MRSWVIALAMLLMYLGTVTVYYGIHGFAPPTPWVFAWLCSMWMFMSLTQGALNDRRRSNVTAASHRLIGDSVPVLHPGSVSSPDPEQVATERSAV